MSLQSRTNKRKSSGAPPGEPRILSASAANLGLAARIRHARLARGARLKDLADAARCSESLISKIENSRVNPSLNVLHRLCEALNLTIGELFAAPGNNDRIVTFCYRSDLPHGYRNSGQTEARILFVNTPPTF